MSTAATAERPATSAEVLARYEPEPEAAALIDPTAPPAESIERLSAAGHPDDAIDFLARWLTKREAVWWGALCVWDALRPQVDPKREEVLEAIVQWVLEPSEERRRALGDLAQRARGSHPEAGIARAAFFSEGSITPPDKPELQADEDTTASLVSAAIRATATKVPGRRREEAYRQFLRFGLEIVEGQSHWDKE